ncbi:hypothetical protein PWT90_01308 [Aphanocladium album]|nr:hypothetical protein PWT90_01308 [Aphanocladium album]
MKTIVVLGTGVASAAVIRLTMRSTVLKRSDVRMVVISPSTHFIWPLAMPRAVLPGQFIDHQFMFELRPILSDYPADKFEFILGTANALDTGSKMITVSLNDGVGEVGATAAKRIVAYDAVVIATGASSLAVNTW